MRAIFLILALLAAAPAAAISDAGDLIIGGQGIIQGTMTVSGQDASGYSLKLASGVQSGGCYKFGDGTTQCTAGGTGSGNAVLSATQTWTGGNTLYGSTTFYGSITLTGDLIRKSTFTMFGYTTATNVNVCVTTVTFTPESSFVDVIFMGTINNGASGDPCLVGFLIDGEHPPGWSSNTAMSMGTSGHNQDASFTYPSLAVAPDISHSVCLRGGCAGYNIGFCGTSGVSYYTKCKFGMRESQ